MRLFTFSDNNHKLMFDWNVYCHNYVSTAPEKSCKYHQMKDTGVVRNISWSRCHHKSRPWSPFICVNISGKYDKGDHNNDKGVHTWWSSFRPLLFVLKVISHDTVGRFKLRHSYKHHDDDDSRLWVSILQVISLPCADFTPVQHLRQIDLNHPSCCDDRVYWVSLSLNKV